MESKKGIIIRVACIAGLLGIVVLISWLKEGKKEYTDNFLEDTVWRISSSKTGTNEKNYTFSFGEKNIDIESDEKAGCIQALGTYRVIDDKKIQFDFDLIPEEFNIKKHCIAEYTWPGDENGGNTLQISFEDEKWRLTFTQNKKAENKLSDGCWTGVEGDCKGYSLLYRNGTLYVINNDAIITEMSMNIDFDKVSVYDYSCDALYQDIAFEFDEDRLILESETEKNVFQREDMAEAEMILKESQEKTAQLEDKIKLGFWTAEINGETYCFYIKNKFYLFYNETNNYLIAHGYLRTNLSQKVFADKYHSYDRDDKKYVFSDMEMTGDDFLLAFSLAAEEEAEKALGSGKEPEGETLIPQTLFKKEEINRLETAQQDIGTELLPYWDKVYECGDLRMFFSESNGMKVVTISSPDQKSGYGYLVNRYENEYQILWLDRLPLISELYLGDDYFSGVSVMTVNESGISFAQDGNTYEFISQSEE